MFDTPFSSTVLRVYLGVLRAVGHVFSWIKPLRNLSAKTTKHHRDLSDRYRSGILEGNAKLLEEEALKPSSEIAASIVECILLVLDEDHALETFFDAVPGFFGSQLVRPRYSPVTTKLRQSLDSFLDRTFSSRLVTESVKNDRFITCLNAAHSALGPIGASQILDSFFRQHKDEALKSVELGHSLISWVHSTDDPISPIVRRIVTCIIAHAKDRDDRWAKLVKEAFDVPDGVIRDYVARGDSMLLAILNHVTRQALRTGRSEQEVLESLSQFDIHNTAAELRHDFCTLWNEIVQEARNEGFGSTRSQILAGIRRLFVTLHRGTDAASSQFPAPLDSIGDSDAILRWPLLYPSCNIPSHHPDSAAQGPAIATPPKSRIRRNSEPAIGASVIQRPQSSRRLRRTQSYTHFPTVPLSTQPSHPLRSLPRPALVSQLPLSKSPEVVTKDAMPDFADVSGVLHTADPIHVSSTTSGPTVQQVEKTRTTPPSVALGSLPTPLPTPALSHSTTSAMLPSSIDPAAAETHLLHHSPGALALTATHLSVSLQDTTVSDQQPGLGRTLGQDDMQNSRPLAQKMDPDQPPPGGATVL